MRAAAELGYVDQFLIMYMIYPAGRSLVDRISHAKIDMYIYIPGL